MSSREFNQDVSAAKRASETGPVFITDRGRPSFVLMSIKDYQALSGEKNSVAEVFSSFPAGDDVEFPRVLNGEPRFESFE